MGRSSQLSLIRRLQPQSQSLVAQTYSSQTTRRRRGFECPLLPGSLDSNLSKNLHFSSTFSISNRFLSSSPDFSHLPGARKPAGKTVPILRPLQITPQHAKDAFEHCVKLVKEKDVDSYLSILTMPKKVQAELIALHAFNVELALIRDKISTRGNDTSGMYRLQFWKDALSSIYANSDTPVPRQPVAVALCSFAPSAEPPLLENLVTARQQSLGDRPFSTVFELCGYGMRTNGSLIQLTCGSLSRHLHIPLNDDVTKAASDISSAYGVVNLIRSTLPLLTKGVVLLPQDLLTLNSLTVDDVYRKKKPEDVQRVVKDIVRIADKHLASGRQRVASLPRGLRPAFSSSAASTSHVLKMIRKVDYNIYDSRLQLRDPLLLWTLLFNKLLGKC